jgi:hypothetical protein
MARLPRQLSKANYLGSTLQQTKTDDAEMLANSEIWPAYSNSAAVLPKKTTNRLEQSIHRHTARQT